MDPHQHLILVKGEDRTREIASCQSHPDTKRVHVTFNNGKEYPYSRESIVWLQTPRNLDPNDHWVYRGHERLQDVAGLQLFESAKVGYWHLTFQNGQERSLPFAELKVLPSCLAHGPSRNLLDYLRRVAELIGSELKTDDGTAILTKAYQKAHFIGEETAFAAFSDPQHYTLKSQPWPQALYPFGINASQLLAVERALTNQVSIIQGPPGTGKTQTILNIPGACQT